MGAWHYIAPTLYELAAGSLTVGYIGRQYRSSTAGGDPLVHKKEQERIIEQALNTDSIVVTQNQEKESSKNR
jgi:2-oxoglutarate dehydrogenase E1 component